ncbi:MAG: HD domain-containing protein [Spirochaetales bacterium]|nr:HD domain-containing protein [Spirochaetales bacterium]
MNNEENSEIEKKLKVLEDVHRATRKNFKDVVQLLIAVISLSDKFLGGHLKRVAELAREFGLESGYSDDIREMIYYSALLHDIGMVGMPERIITGNPENFSYDDKIIYAKHPLIGEKIISSAYSLKRISEVIRSHHEHFDGTGFPDELKGEKIPFGARVACILSDYDSCLFKKGLSLQQTKETLLENSSLKYDPAMLETFSTLIDKKLSNLAKESHIIPIKSLQPGMFLKTDIVLKNGLLLLPKGVLVNSGMLKKLASFYGFIDDRVKRVEVIY